MKEVLKLYVGIIAILSLSAATTLIVNLIVTTLVSLMFDASFMNVFTSDGMCALGMLSFLVFTILGHVYADNKLLNQ